MNYEWNDYMQNKMRAKMKKAVCQKVALFTARGKKNSWNWIIPVFHVFFVFCTYVYWKKTREIQFHEIFCLRM